MHMYRVSEIIVINHVNSLHILNTLHAYGALESTLHVLNCQNKDHIQYTGTVSSHLRKKSSHLRATSTGRLETITGSFIYGKFFCWFPSHFLKA
jgi:hypothetical protein